MEKKIINSNFDLLTNFFEKYNPKHLISLLKNFYYIFCRFYLKIKKTNSGNVPTQFMILNVDFAFKLSNYTSWKLFMFLMNPKKISTILHTQLNHQTSLERKHVTWQMRLQSKFLVRRSIVVI